MAGAPVCWMSRLQVTVAQSTTEAEFQAVNEAAREAAWTRSLLTELDMISQGPIQLLNDKNGAIDWSSPKSKGTPARQKCHVNIKFHDYCQDVREGTVEMRHVPTAENSADVLTKELEKVKHDRALNLLGLYRRKSIGHMPPLSPPVCTLLGWAASDAVDIAKTDTDNVQP